jgi:DNA repair ATPase RecN
LDPDLIQTLIGVGGGLFGTLVGGLIAFFTLRAQLKHEAKEKERERQLTLRRDVYLEAMEAIGKSQFFLGTFSRDDLDIPKILEQLQEIPGALSKAQLVASEETFTALDHFGELMASSSIDLLALRLRVNHLREEIEAQNLQISQLEQRFSYVRELVQAVPREDPRHEQGRLELDRIQNELMTERNRLQRLTQRNVEVTEHLGREAVKATFSSQVEAGKVILQIRREIELPLKEEWYLRHLAEREGRFQPKIDAIYRDVDDIFEETDTL